MNAIHKKWWTKQREPTSLRTVKASMTDNDEATPRGADDGRNKRRKLEQPSGAVASSLALPLPLPHIPAGAAVGASQAGSVNVGEDDKKPAAAPPGGTVQPAGVDPLEGLALIQQGQMPQQQLLNFSPQQLPQQQFLNFLPHPQQMQQQQQVQLLMQQQQQLRQQQSEQGQQTAVAGSTTSTSNVTPNNAAMLQQLILQNQAMMAATAAALSNQMNATGTGSTSRTHAGGGNANSAASPQQQQQHQAFLQAQLATMMPLQGAAATMMPPNMMMLSGALQAPPGAAAAQSTSNAAVALDVSAQQRLSGHRPILLYMSCDHDSLSEYQCLVRKQIELFEAMPQDVESNAKGRNKPIVLGQVNLREREARRRPINNCTHCSHTVA